MDYAGPTIPIIDALTSEITKAQIFFAVLGASSHTFAMATSTQKTADWLLGHRKAFEYFGGVTQVITPDNPRSWIANPDRYEPQVSRSYAELAAHYGCAVIPSRPRKPQDKSKVVWVHKWLSAGSWLGCATNSSLAWLILILPSPTCWKSSAPAL